MKPFWISVFLILTLLGISSGSGNIKAEVYMYWTNWTWQNTFDLMIILWMLNYCTTALYLTLKFTGETITLARLKRDINRGWLHKLKLEREQAAQPKPRQLKQKKRRRKKQGEW